MREQNGRFFFADSGSSRFCKAGYDPAEPRDKYSRWTREGSSTVAYQGHFHDLVVDDFLEGLKSQGSTVLKNIRILGLSGAIAIPDGASKPAGNNKPYFIEMKTGMDPKFTANQKEVYPLICLGGHATSFDTRVSQLGLTAGTPFPPMRILLVTTSGPGQPFGYIDYCQAIGMEVH